MEAAVELVSEKMNVKLKDKQLEAVLSFMSGNDVFVSLPTGYGKSLVTNIVLMFVKNQRNLSSITGSTQLI